VGGPALIYVWFVTALAWLAIPLVALLCAIVAVTWIGRPRRKAEMRSSVRSYERFRAALAAPPTGRDQHS
jgi:hypothetical protein